MDGHFAGFHYEDAKGAGKRPQEMEQPGIEQTRSDLAGLGTPPPIHYLSGLTPILADLGRMHFRLPVSDWLLSSRGEIGSTAIGFVADAPMGGAVLTTVPERTATPTVELSLLFLGVAETSVPDLIAQGRLIASNGATGASMVEVYSGDRLLAVGTTRVMIEPILVPVPERPRAVVDSIDPYQRPTAGGIVPPQVWSEAYGIEVLKGQIAGELPHAPIAELMGFRFDVAEEGLVAGRALASTWMTSPSGTLYGGWVASVLDLAVTGAAQSVALPGGREVPLDLKVNYLRPLVPQGQVLAVEARLTHRGRRIVVAEATLAREDGKQMARSVGTARLMFE